MPIRMTYTKSGVNIERADFAKKELKKWLEKTFKFREGKIGEVVHEIGHFANMIDLGNNFAIAMTTDGVGSKVLVAQELEIYDTVGIDLVAMLVNDLICVGAEPLAMVDYLALKQVDPEIVKEIAVGIYKGAKIANISVIGGETASLPDIIKGVGNKGFDLAGAAIGIVEKDKIIDGRKILPNDIVLGLKSSGIHSNGLTLARKVLPKDLWLGLLTPTKIYVSEILELIKKFEIHGLANITGGGFRKLQRISKFGFLLDNLPKPQMIFKKIQEIGNVSDEEMYKTFNMGVGFCVITDEENANLILKNYGEEYKLMKIGKVVQEEEGIRILKDGEEIKLN